MLLPRFLFFFIVPLVLIGAYAAAQEQAQTSPRIIDMTATDYKFEPSSVHVKAGETVRISVTAKDKEHGIRIKPVPEGSPAGTPAGLEIAGNQNCVKFKKNETGTIEFTARTPGTYDFECCKLCGFGHGKMKGEVIVDPS